MNALAFAYGLICGGSISFAARLIDWLRERRLKLPDPSGWTFVPDAALCPGTYCTSRSHFRFGQLRLCSACSLLWIGSLQAGRHPRFARAVRRAYTQEQIDRAPADDAAWRLGAP